MASVVVNPPTERHGQRLLPSLVDEIALQTPDKVLYSVTKTKDPADGFQDITFKEFSHAVNSCAWLIESQLGKGDGFPTISYLGPQDVTYAVITLAAIKAGYKVLLSSPRNPLEAHLSLLEQTKCSVFAKPPVFPLPVVKEILAARPMRVLDIPAFASLIEGEDKPYPYTRTFTDARLEPFVVLHTSGSTGMPKPIVQSHGTLAALDAFTTLPSQGLQDTYPAMCRGKRVYLAFPLFHCAGLSMLLPAPIYGGWTTVLGPFPPSANVADAIHVHGNVQHSCLAPMTLIELTKTPEHLNSFSRLEQVTYGGGPLPPAVGNLISERTKLLNCLGTTECGVQPVQLCGSDSWSYMSVNPALGHEYRHVSGDLYEQVIVRQPHLDPYQGVFCTFPDLDEWPMRDLYTKHPTKENQWLYKGRTDDILVFSTGEKLNPVDMESIICAHPQVTGAVICGQGRFQSSLVIEVVKPPSTKEEAKGILDEIWPSVEAANKVSPTHGRIHRHMVAIASAEKPMRRAGKGTVQRKLTVELYEAEIASLYYEATNQNADQGYRGQSVSEAVLSIISQSTDIDVTQLNTDADLFEYGLDSLQVTAISRQMNSYLSANVKAQTCQARIIYANPSIAGLNKALSALYEGSNNPTVQAVTIASLYDEFATELPISLREPHGKNENERVVLLTGSTGSLGSYILNSLQNNHQVSRVYCLNRGPGSEARQRTSQASKGLSELGSKVQFYDADITKPYFGLSGQDYTRLLATTTDIVHVAWKVDFNLSLPSFRAHIGAVRRLVDFSAASRYQTHIFFVSSISTVLQVPGVHEEKVYRDWKAPEAMGYAQSKFVAEVLLDEATRVAGTPATICRVGQIAGPTTTAGKWPTTEWLPSLIKSSKHIGKLPSSLGRLDKIDWVPVDVLGEVIVQLALAPVVNSQLGAKVFQPINPQISTWSDLLPAVQEHLGSLEVVSLKDWLAALQSSAEGSAKVLENPAVKILEFYTSLVDGVQNNTVTETKNSVSTSPALAELGAVDAKLMANWMQQWKREMEAA